MSDAEDDYMCEDEEDYGLVRYLYTTPIRRRTSNLTFLLGVLGRQQLRARRRSGEPILQQQGAEGG